MKTWTVVALWAAYGLLAATTVLSVWTMQNTVNALDDHVVELEHVQQAPVLAVTDPHLDFGHHDHVHDEDTPDDHDHTHVVVHAHPHGDDHGDPIPEDIPATSTLPDTTTAPDSTLTAPESTIGTTMAPDTTVATTATTTTLPPEAHTHVVDHSHDHDHTIILVPANPTVLIGGANPGVLETVPPTTFISNE